MTAPPPSGGGLFDSLRRLGRTALEVADVRLELVGTELEFEKLRLARALLLGAFGLVLGTVALVLFTALVLLLLQEPYLKPALAALVVVYGVLAVVLFRRARELLQSGPEGPFALTRAELRRDRDSLLTPAP